MDLINVMSGSRTMVFEIVRGPEATHQTIDRLLDELQELREVAWVTRSYGESLADVSLENDARTSRHIAVSHIQELFLQSDCRLREVTIAA